MKLVLASILYLIETLFKKYIFNAPANVSSHIDGFIYKNSMRH